MIRFHLDEHVPHAIAEGLRRRGIDVTTTVEAGLRSATDDVHLAYAVEQRRVVVTNDPDFLVLA
jgi:predicted nuclease of predicted toxin-antitoxin system